MSIELDHRHIICIFGTYSAKRGDPAYEQAYEIGRGLARAGYIVANGGYDGTMEASARGAKDAGGLTIGVTCSAFSNARGRVLKANRYIDHEIHHDHILTRIRQMIDMSSGYVVLEGGTGTLTEFSLAWEYVCKHLVAPRPIFIVGDFWRPMIDRMLAVRPRTGKHLHFVDSAEELVVIAARTIHGSCRRSKSLSLIDPPAETVRMLPE